MFHIADISFEWIESTLDTLVEHLLHTDIRQTQIIVFYLLVGIAALPFYYLRHNNETPNAIQKQHRSQAVSG